MGECNFIKEATLITAKINPAPKLALAEKHISYNGFNLKIRKYFVSLQLAIEGIYYCKLGFDKLQDLFEDL